MHCTTHGLDYAPFDANGNGQDCPCCVLEGRVAILETGIAEAMEILQRDRNITSAILRLGEAINPTAGGQPARGWAGGEPRSHLSADVPTRPCWLVSPSGTVYPNPDPASNAEQAARG